MDIRKTFASLKDAFLNAVILPGARASEALIAEDPAFAGKLAQAREIVEKDYAFLSNYLPRPVLIGSPVGIGYTIWPLTPSTYEILGAKAERERKIDGCLYKDGFRRAVENTCAQGRQLQSESDVRAKFPKLFEKPDFKPVAF